MFERELKEFGQRMGMQAFAFSDSGIAALDIEGVGRVSFETAGTEDESELLVYVSTPVQPYDTSVAGRVLTLCDYRNAHPYDLSGGVYKDRAVLLVRLGYRSVSASEIENAVRFLMSAISKALAS